MSEVDSEALPTDTKSKIPVSRIAIIVLIIVVCFFMFWPKSNLKPLVVDKNEVVTKTKLKDGIAGLDVAAAFATYEGEQVALKTEMSLLSNSIANQEINLKSATAELKKEIVDTSNRNAIEITKAVDVFRKYIDKNATQFAGGNNSTIDIGGINFDTVPKENKRLTGSHSKSGSETRATKSNSQSRSNSSNYISFNTDILDSANAVAKKTGNKGIDKVSNLFSDGSEKNKKVKSPKVPKNESVLIDGSWVDAQLFHGLRCPIINAVSTISGNSKPSAVTMMVRGIFHGPNGDTTDIGPVHIYGVCTGNRTGDDEFGIADIEIKEISFSMNNKKESVKLEGYVLDIENEDNMNMPGLKGPIDAVQASTLADSAIAAALSVASLGFRATQTTTLTDPLTGKTASVFDGDPIKDALTQGLGGYFLDLHKSFTSLKDTAVDSVLVKSGSNIRIFITSKFTVPNEESNFDVFDQDDQTEARYL